MDIKNRVCSNIITTIAGSVILLLDLVYLSAEILRLAYDSEHELDVDWILFVSLLLLSLILIGAKDEVIKQIMSIRNIPKKP